MAPRMINFKAGSIVYFMGDKSDSVYLLKEGKVNLVYNDIQTGEEIIDVISTGEFFGVKSGLIFYPREETAKVITNSIIIQFTTQDFEALITKNTSIILKMLKVFSNQLRKIGKQVQSLITNKMTTDPEDDFFFIGEYYFKNKKYSQAIVVYKRYLYYYPAGKHAYLAEQREHQAENALRNYGDGGGPTPNLEIPSPSSSGSSSSFKSLSDETISASSEEEKIYNNGLNFMKNNKYGDAFNEFKKLLTMSNEEYKILANYEIGKCLFFVKKYNDCIQHLSSFVQKNPKFSEIADVLYYIGYSYYHTDNKQKGLEYLKKALALAKPNDDVYRKIQKTLREIG